MEINITIKDIESVDVVYDDSSCNWEDNAELNQLFLLNIQQKVNRHLKYHGHVFLNEVYDLLGHKRTPLGAIMGWVYEKDKKIDFGFTEEYYKNPTVNVPLHFNIDGVIVNKI